MHNNDDRKALAWQTRVWDTMSDVYLAEVDRRFVPVIEGVLRRAEIGHGDTVLDLGTGTGSVALLAGGMAGDSGRVHGHDISRDMLSIAAQRASQAGLQNVEFEEGRAEQIPAEDSSFDVVRFVAAVWAGPDECDIVMFQQTAGSFAPPPPVTGVGPGAIADTAEFVGQLANAGIRAEVDKERLGFEFSDFESAWEVLAGVTTAKLEEDVVAQAKNAVRELMWQDAETPRYFHNTTQFIVGRLE